jgi:hypothetical protein
MPNGSDESLRQSSEQVLHQLGLLLLLAHTVHSVPHGTQLECDFELLEANEKPTAEVDNDPFLLVLFMCYMTI